jgi:acetyl esterase/lipase
MDLAARGWATWNIEYRRVGNGGGWPATFEDVAAALDHLRVLDVDADRVVVIGHSAGGHLAAWAAGRSGLAAGQPGAGPRVRVTGVVAQAGVLDLATAARQGVGGSAVPDLIGGLPDVLPERYAVADPIAAVPVEAEILCVHSRADFIVPFTQSEAYVAAAKAAGGRARLVETSGDHFTLIDPSSADWAKVVDALPHLQSG